MYPATRFCGSVWLNGNEKKRGSVISNSLYYRNHFGFHFHHIHYIWKYSYIKLDKKLRILKQVYYPIIKFYLLIQIYFFGLRPKCALKTPAVHFPKNDGTEKNAVTESGFKDLNNYCNIVRVIVVVLIFFLHLAHILSAQIVPMGCAGTMTNVTSIKFNHWVSQSKKK